MVRVHCRLSHDDEHLCRYIKCLKLMEELWTGQAILSHLTLNCDLDLEPSHTVLTHFALTHDGEHLCLVILNSCN